MNPCCKCGQDCNWTKVLQDPTFGGDPEGNGDDGLIAQENYFGRDTLTEDQQAVVMQKLCIDCYNQQ